MSLSWFPKMIFILKYGQFSWLYWHEIKMFYSALSTVLLIFASFTVVRQFTLCTSMGFLSCLHCDDGGLFRWRQVSQPRRCTGSGRQTAALPRERLLSRDMGVEDMRFAHPGLALSWRLSQACPVELDPFRRGSREKQACHLRDPMPLSGKSRCLYRRSARGLKLTSRLRSACLFLEVITV